MTEIKLGVVHRITFTLLTCSSVAQRLVEPSKQLKQIIEIEHNIFKTPNWLGRNQLAIYKCSQGFEHGDTMKQIQVVVRAGLKPETAGLQVRRADH